MSLAITAKLSTLFGALAVLLAAIGLYGVMAGALAAIPAARFLESAARISPIVALRQE